MAVLLALLAALWYARPVDVYTLGHLEAVNRIYIAPSYYEKAFGEAQRLDGVELDASDPRFASILERVEALRFQRSPLDLMTRHFREKRITGSPVLPDTYFYLLYINDGGDYLHLQFFMDRWYYSTPEAQRILPVGMKDAAVGNDLGQFLWDTVKPGS